MYLAMIIITCLILSMMISNHSPFTMILSLISITLVISIKTMMNSSSTWMSIMLFMSIVGGLMILFISVASASKTKSSMKMNLFYFFMPMLMITENKMKNEFPIFNKSISTNTSILLFLSLNIILFFISKMIFSPNKPFKSNSYMVKLSKQLISNQKIYTMTIKNCLDTTMKIYKSIVMPMLAITSLKTSLIISIFLSYLMWSLESKSKKNKSSSSAFESGFQQMNAKKPPLNNQFFMISILFVIFDMELIILMPIPMMKKNMLNSSFLVIMTLLLILSLMMEWTSGLLEWSES